jgi:hypothetical protein
MYLAYFDENKYEKSNPYFFIGGILIPIDQAIELENILSEMQSEFFSSNLLKKENEFHGKDLFHGKGNCKGRDLSERVKVFEGIQNFIIENSITVRIVCINVPAHRETYKYPDPEYRLGLMLLLERFCDYLDSVDKLGVVFGDYEKDEITSSILDFSQFKFQGTTPMYFGRPLGRLIDTIYFTHSHHSRFLQVSDILVYMAGRFENWTGDKKKWHDKKVESVWNQIKTNADFKIQYWP